MIGLALVAVGGIAFAVHAAERGDWMPVEFAAVMFAAYAAVFAGEWCLRRRIGR